MKKILERLKSYALFTKERQPNEAEKWRQLAIEYYWIAEKAKKERNIALREKEAEKAWKEYYKTLVNEKENDCA